LLEFEIDMEGMFKSRSKKALMIKINITKQTVAPTDWLLFSNYPTVVSIALYLLPVAHFQ